ncbi:MAG TPA: type II toxin-antitoxin system RelE/ParE family toxin [Urbifossiella sp.]|jgi:plasmid stabilization system protein ParE|nr:type II toxin-antitoxin system RelE/ParE family toxin [Urbifossiella sp.]
MNVRFLDAAASDAVQAAEFLERRRRGTGDRFEAAVRRAVAAIGRLPQAHPRTEDGPHEPENREVFITRFRYRVVYAIWQGEAVIVAVVHAHQEPAAWVTRLDDLTDQDPPPTPA